MCALAIRAAPRRVANPKADPRFVAVTEQVNAGAARLRKHAPPGQKAREASKSAKAPPNERLSRAKKASVAAVNDAPTPAPETASFEKLLRAEIDKAMPKTLGDTENFMDSGAAGAMKGALKGSVDKQKGDASGPLAAATNKPPDPAAVPAAPWTGLPAEPAPQAPPVDGASAMPPPAAPAEVSLEQSKQDTSQALADENIKPPSLQRANDPRFSAVAEAQAKVVAQASSAPAAFRAQESAVLSGARAQAGAGARRGALLLARTRGAGNVKVLTRQQEQAVKEQAERTKVACDIETMYAVTTAKVEKNLASLDADVAALYDPGIDAAVAEMKSYVDDKISDYKWDRYLSIPLVGQARWLRDQVRGLPKEADVFYVEGRRVFLAAVDRLIARVAALVEQRLAQAKAEVSAGQRKIKSYVDELPANLKDVGKAAEKNVSDRFTELAASIDDKKQELASSLASKYKEAFDKADEALKKIQDENKGLIQKFAEKLAAIIKAIREFKDRLLAQINKQPQAIDLILDDPIGFLGNLLAAVKGGVNAFVGRIDEYLQAGFVEWLFGALAPTSIVLPTSLTPGSLLHLVLQVIPISYDKMRAKAVKLLGPGAVTLIEKVGQYLKTLVEGGPDKLWELVQEDLSDLKHLVVDAIKDWLTTTIIKKGAAKIVSMFNPVGAIVQAILMIVDVVMFIVENAEKLLALIETVMQSITAIATGAIGDAISWIEKALARTVPLVIGFLARLLGLSGITDKITSTIKKVQRKVDQAIDKAMAKVVATVKKLFGAVKAGVKKLLNWWKKKLPIGGDKEPHTLTFSGEQQSARLVIMSAPQKPHQFVRSVGKEKKATKPDPALKAKETEDLEKPIDASRAILAKIDAAPGKETELVTNGAIADKEMTKLDSSLTTLQAHVVATLKAWQVAEEPMPANLAEVAPDEQAFQWTRPDFSAKQKAAIAAQHKATMARTTDPAALANMKTMLKDVYQGPGPAPAKVVKDGYVRLDIARRHVVSSGDMAKHYQAELVSKSADKPLFPSAAKLLLEQRTSIGAAMTPVSGKPPTPKDIVKAAKARHRKFFGYAKNIFLGNTAENSALQEKLDRDHPEMDAAKLDEHIRHIKRAWALSTSFEPTK